MSSIFGKGGKGIKQPEDALNLAPDQAKKLISYYEQSVPGFLELSKKFGPEFMGQMFEQTGAFLGGAGGQPGFTELLRTTGAETGETIGGLREDELAQMAGQVPLTRGLMEKLSPEQAAAVKEASRVAEGSKRLESDFLGRSKGMMDKYGSKVGTYAPTLGDISGYAGTTISDEQAQSLYDTSMAQQLAEESFARRGTLSPEEQRAAQQQAREARAASGRLGGNAAIAAEIQNREAAKAARRAEASTFGERAATQGMNAEQLRVAAQQARYTQLGAEQDRELARRQNLFAQRIGAGAQQAEERKLGFSQLMDIEERRRLAREEAALAGNRSYTMAGGFYTQPGLGLLSQTPLSYGEGKNTLATALTMGPGSSGTFDYNMPLGLAKERAGALDAYNMAKYKADQERSANIMKMVGTVGGLALAPFTGGLTAGLGLTSAAGGIGSALGTTGFNLGASAFNAGAGMFGAPLKATIV